MAATNKHARRISFGMAAANLLLVVCVVLSVVSALRKAQEISFQQNIENIRTLTDASASKIELEFLHRTHELQRVANFISQYHGTGMTESQMLMFFSDLYASPDEAYRWEVIDSTPNNEQRFSAVTPCASNGDFSYRAESYPELARVFSAADEDALGQVNYTAEFTDPSPALDKVSALTCAVRLRTESGNKYKTLMLQLKSSYTSQLLSCNNDVDTLSYFDYSNIIVDDDGNYVISNPQFQGTNFLDYIALYNNGFLPQDADALSAQLCSNDYSDVLFYDNSRGQACAYTIVPVQNSDWHILSIVPLESFRSEYNFGNSFLTFAVLFGLLFTADITTVVLINRQLRRRTQEAQAANEAKTDFLSRMSHDIRTPINVINGMTELALQEENPPETRDYLRDIRFSSTFLLGLVNDILDMNKVESGKMELFPKPYSYMELRSYIYAIISPQCNAKGITFSVRCNEEDIVLSVDKMRINQILFNLLSNAVKFTPENGHISLDITVTKGEGHRAAMDFSVKDDGIGMSEEFQKHMFSAFSQENRPEERQLLGTGLGLAIVKNLVDMMNGSIRVESKIGQGTTFFVHVEAGVSDEPAPSAQQEHQDITALRGRRVLLCEDQPMNAKIIVRLLALQDIEVDTAENGKVGVETIRSAPPEYYDAVLMDVRMPVMNGLEAAKAIRDTHDREDLQRIPIIALTANAYDSDVRACFDAGMNEHLSKPIDKGLLYDALVRQIHD